MTVRVVFVCTANICRSAFLQAYARAAGVDADVEFTSAGTHGFDAAPMSDEMTVESAAWGLDPSTHRSRPLTAEILAEADLVVTAERRHRQYVLDDHPEAFAKVITLGQAARAAAQLEPGDPAEVVRAIGRLRGNAVTGDDVEDPYLRGAPAQEVAARKMSAMLDPLLAALGPVDHFPRRTSDG